MSLEACRSIALVARCGLAGGKKMYAANGQNNLGNFCRCRYAIIRPAFPFHSPNSAQMKKEKKKTLTRNSHFSMLNCAPSTVVLILTRVVHRSHLRRRHLPFILVFCTLFVCTQFLRWCLVLSIHLAIIFAFYIYTYNASLDMYIVYRMFQAALVCCVFIFSSENFVVYQVSSVCVCVEGGERQGWFSPFSMCSRFSVVIFVIGPVSRRSERMKIARKFFGHIGNGHRTQPHTWAGASDISKT